MRFRYGADGVVVERERDAVLLLREGPRAGRAQLSEALPGRGAVIGPLLPWPQVPEGVRLAELTGELVGPRARDRSSPTITSPSWPCAARREPWPCCPPAAWRPWPAFATPSATGSWRRCTAGCDTGARVPRSSSELFVHPQTVSYRLKRLRTLLGDDLDGPAARFELLLVLAARRNPTTRTGGPNPDE